MTTDRPGPSFALPGAAPQAPLPLDLPRPSGRRSGVREPEGDGEGEPANAELREQLVDRVMAESGVVVTLVDPPGAGVRARWYRVSVQPTLDGRLDVVRAWGRLPVGERPHQLVTCHSGVGETLTAVRDVVARRLRRGYRPEPGRPSATRRRADGRGSGRPHSASCGWSGHVAAGLAPLHPGLAPQPGH